MNKKNDRVKVCKIEISEDLYKQIEKISSDRFNAKNEISSTILKLIQLAINNLDAAESSTQNNSSIDSKTITELVDKRVEELLAAQLVEIISEMVDDAIAGKQEEIKATVRESIEEYQKQQDEYLNQLESKIEPIFEGLVGKVASLSAENESFKEMFSTLTTEDAYD
jgi:hypothetical protein